jgi:hypothetical protein
LTVWYDQDDNTVEVIIGGQATKVMTKDEAVKLLYEFVNILESLK